MLYINETDIKTMGINWTEIFSQLEQAVVCLANHDYAQPIKPYLRYRDLKNRIIAMPAFVGGQFNVSEISGLPAFWIILPKIFPELIVLLS
jgi:hypothetical protein